MHFKTVQASALKASFEVLKDILNDVNVVFDEGGMKILTLDTARVALVDFKLSADSFDEYSCDGEVIAGINITNTFKLLKTITNNDVVTFDINDMEFLHIKIENTTKKSSTTFKLKLLDIDDDRIEVPPVNMNVVTVMPSVDFQRINRDMNNISSEVSIHRKNNSFIISCVGDFANQETVIDCGDDTAFEGSIRGVYSLKYVNLFTKATGMCSTIQIMQEEHNRFLVLKYNVADLGELKFYLSTKTEEC